MLRLRLRTRRTRRRPGRVVPCLPLALLRLNRSRRRHSPGPRTRARRRPACSSPLQLLLRVRLRPRRQRRSESGPRLRRTLPPRRRRRRSLHQQQQQQQLLVVLLVAHLAPRPPRVHGKPHCRLSSVNVSSAQRPARRSAPVVQARTSPRPPFSARRARAPPEPRVGRGQCAASLQRRVQWRRSRSLDLVCWPPRPPRPRTTHLFSLLPAPATREKPRGCRPRRSLCLCLSRL